MKQKFIVKEGNDRLALFFAGWGSEQNLFDCPVAEGYDYMLCYGYQDLDFDFSGIEGYRQIRLLAWSMGVWAAGKTFGNRDLPWEMRIAVNGTLSPIDDDKGIPEAVFKGTLLNFSDATVSKFRRRMCDGAQGLDAFLAHGPVRTTADLKNELQAIYDMVKSSPSPRFGWDKAVIGFRDRIFPPENQEKAHTGILTEKKDCAHYDDGLFRSYLKGENGEWTKI